MNIHLEAKRVWRPATYNVLIRHCPNLAGFGLKNTLSLFTTYKLTP